MDNQISENQYNEAVKLHHEIISNGTIAAQALYEIPFVFEWVSNTTNGEIHFKAPVCYATKPKINFSTISNSMTISTDKLQLFIRPDINNNILIKE